MPMERQIRHIQKTYRTDYFRVRDRFPNAYTEIIGAIKFLELIFVVFGIP